MIVKGILADADGVIDPKGNVVDINLSSQTSSPPNATSAIQFSKNLNSTEAPLTGTVTQAHTTGAITTFTLAPESLPITKVEIDDPSDNPLTEGTDFTVNYTTGQVRILAANPDGDYTVTYHEPNYSIDVPIYDSKGESYTANIYYTKVADNTWEVDTAIADPSATDTLLTDGKGTLTFDPITGKMTSSTVTNATKTITGAANLNFTLDFSNVTEYAGESTAIYNSQDGYTAGYLQDVSVDTSGTITGSFSNGKSRKLAQVAIATFPNPSGLTKDGNNNFQVSYNSGEPDAGIPGISGRGTIKPETLEMSNVDLSQEFVDMIITQRGFQANSRVITTSDQILEELVNLRR
jgi:flagellar hook-basal body protein